MFGVFGIFVLAVAVWAVRATPALTWVALLLGFPVVVLTVLEGVYPDSEQVRLWSAVLHALFYGYTAYGLVRYLFDDTCVTRDEVFAVGANFTVVAWGFAYLFIAVQIIWPGSFIAYQGEGSQNFPRAALPVLRDADQRRAVRRHRRCSARPLGRHHRAGGGRACTSR